MGDELLIALVAVFIAVVVALVFFQRKLRRQLSAKVDALTLLVKEADKQRDSLRQEVHELRNGTIGVGRRVLELEKQLSSQDARLDEAIQQEPQARMYSRAIKMVQLGAGVDELMRECELPKAEAELLLRLHSK
ncbi:DNA repair protein [Shewanella mangrovi]|uniref:DNA repair protein n=1 Tax=Shewanella mangrovi TaxID=1515746 RepID=A0A094JWT8_9GAMM|nr:DNA repair protein [Shewanella mangrovi]